MGFGVHLPVLLWSIRLLETTPIVVSPKAQLFANATARLTNCDIPGAVRPLPQGREIHKPNSVDWHWSDDGLQSCDGTCTYHDDFGAGAFWCPLLDGLDRLHCGCQSCPCQDGMGGFLCSHCVDDAACRVERDADASPSDASAESAESEQKRPWCSKSTAVDRKDKAFTCSFSDAFRRSPSYKLFWPEGWSNPEVFIQHTPSAGTVSFDFIHNMCTKHQPILMQCTCSDCNTRADEVRFGHKLMGVCRQSRLPSPCVKCETCRCSYPEDSVLTGTTRTVISLIRAGVVFGCDEQGCGSIFQDLPMRMSFNCSTGVCEK